MNWIKCILFGVPTLNTRLEALKGLLLDTNSQTR